MTTGSFCIHWTGKPNKVNECCKKGHKYSQFANLWGIGWFPTLPCTSIENANHPKNLTCPDREFPTVDEILKSREEFLAQAGAMLEVLSVLKAGKFPKNSQGRIDCPRCGKAKGLFYSVAYNGHMAAKCDTTGCVQLIE